MACVNGCLLVAVRWRRGFGSSSALASAMASRDGDMCGDHMLTFFVGSMLELPLPVAWQPRAPSCAGRAVVSRVAQVLAMWWFPLCWAPHFWRWDPGGAPRAAMDGIRRRPLAPPSQGCIDGGHRMNARGVLVATPDTVPRRSCYPQAQPGVHARNLILTVVCIGRDPLRNACSVRRWCLASRCRSTRLLNSPDIPKRGACRAQGMR